MRTKTVLISKISIGTRHRRDMGDLQALAGSIGAEGLLQPIGLTPGNELVFGERRLRAVQDILGWDRVPAVVVNVSSIAAWRSARKWTRYKPDYRQCRKAPVRAQQQQGRPPLRLAIPIRPQELGEGRTATARRRQGYSRVGTPRRLCWSHLRAYLQAPPGRRICRERDPKGFHHVGAGGDRGGHREANAGTSRSATSGIEKGG